jgi:endonuclease YncB( thermonuclease family)
MRLPRLGFATSIMILVAAAFAAWLVARPPQGEITGVAEAIDGDSLRISGQELRLRGIDAPELTQVCTVSNREDPCGRNARAALRRLTGSGLVTCLVNGKDRYGRGLARCRVRGIDINAAMVREGHAIAFGEHQDEEAEARAAYRGLWAGTFEKPADWRRRNGRQP